jgi:iron complex outermembrane receptor protein
MLIARVQIKATTVAALFATAGGLIGGTAAAQDGAALEEIIVTAQKRNQALAEIPMSVTVLSGESLERQKAVSYEDLVALVPGFSLTSGTRGVNRITLRGINTGGVASTVGIYVNEVPFGSSSGLANAAVLSGDFDTFDLARIEVLRGPQGTLYGASALGGVLKYVTNAPSTDGFEARAQASVETVADGGPGWGITGLVNVPLGDRVAIRGSAYYRYSDGWIDSIGINPIPGLLNPAVNILEGTRVEEDINDVDAYGGRLAALVEISDSASLTLAALSQNLDSGSSNVVDADPATLEPINDNVRSRYQLDETDISYTILSATLDWDFGGMALQSITSYSEFEQDFRDDVAANSQLVGFPTAQLATAFFGDAVARPLSAVQDQVTSTDKFTQEFRLVSAENDTFEWLVGLYYTDEDSGIDPQQVLAVEAGTDTLATDIPVLVQARLTSEYEEIAAFANATWHLTPSVEVSFGARFSDNDQVASQVLSGAVYDALVPGGAPSFDAAESSESPFTWSFSPRWAINDAVSVYFRAATGYRPGGPNVIPVGAPPGTPGSYDSDELTSYEVGMKGVFAGGALSLDVAGYFLDWEDVQLLAVIDGVGLNANGGTAESKGMEFAATLQATDNLTLALNGAYTDAYLTQDTDPIVGGTDGDALPFVPEWSLGFDADYSWSLAGGSLAYVGGNVGYVGDRPSGFGNLAPDGSIREAEAYTTVGLRGGIEFGAWTLELYGKNLLDEEGVNDIATEGTLPNNAVGLGLIRPRTIGLSAGVRF